MAKAKKQPDTFVNTEKRFDTLETNETDAANETDEAAIDDTKVQVDAEETKEKSTEEELRSQVAELEDRLLLNLADFDNYKKRTARQYELLISSANDRLLCEILDVTDNFERALALENNVKDKGFRKGVEMIHVQLNGLLERYNVSQIDAVGKPFDANLHEALMHVESDEYEKDIVATEICCGYRIGERVLRHSKVGVSKGSSGEKCSQDD